MKKKDIIAIVLAFIAALIITVVVKWLIPVGNQSVEHQNVQKAISIPDIPLMEQKDEKKEKKKEVEYFVLITSREIAKDEKIGMKFLEWKKWPGDALQPYFIAKDEHETPMNNGADYSNAMKMWSKTSIPAGIPLTMSMLTTQDPVAKAKADKKRIAEEQKKKEEYERNNSFIKQGMRAITFSIDQKSAASSNMLKAGDLVDVLIMEVKDGATKMYKYNALKILAIDGITKFEKHDQERSTSVIDSLQNSTINVFSAPKNITLEVPQEKVEVMLRQTQNTGVILSLRSQSENSRGSAKTVDGQKEADEPMSSSAMSVLNDIISINRADLSNEIRNEEKRKETEARQTEAFLNSVSALNSIENSIEQAKQKQAQLRGAPAAAATAKKETSDSSSSSSSSEEGNAPNYEVVSGKIIGEEPQVEEATEPVMIYRKLTPSAVQLDKTGKVVSGNEGAASGASAPR